ncbi:DUF1542 domain-containing protein [Lactobacillus sp. ESL0237]|uniref:SLAP domain-containing protein n=1 Tax=Lactobacillus sp. ESL0237 TaxID=2069357 RepID=UPI000EFA99A3|nr:SLAP domain-containing protein [Lactobacillus sp. ESL0237]RMC40879.1 DUF1542 domain-containing protein [Lactobacillus sp. ESL0237]
MLGKNNYNERLKRMEMQAKRDRFSIRKLSIGTASVFLGFTFFGLNSQAVKANSVIPEQNATEEANQQATDNNQSNATPPSQAATASATKNQDAATSNAPTATKANSNPLSEKTDDKQAKLSTYTGLSTFLKDTDKATAPTAPAQNTKADSLKVDNSNNAQAEVNPNGTSASINTANSQPAITAGNNVQGTTNPTGSTNVPAGSATNNGVPQADANSNPDLTGPAKDSDQQAKLPADSVADANQRPNSTKVPSPVKPLTPADQDKDMTPKVGVQDAYSGSTAKVNNWQDYVKALQDSTVSEIIIVNDIKADSWGGLTPIYFPNRDLVIKSADSGKYTIDYRYSHLIIGSTVTTFHLTYENVNLKCADYYGVIDTETLSPTLANAYITFKDTTFRGNQLAYLGPNTHVTFEGTNDMATIHSGYEPGRNGSDDGQQLLEFSGSGCSIDFNGQFTGSTIGGNVLQTTATNGTININKGANVTLRPGGSDQTGRDNAGSQGGYGINGIVMAGANSVANVQGTLNIEVGSSTYQGSVADRQAATAININSTNSGMTVTNGGSINIKTNGDINTITPYNSLVYVGGNLNIEPKSSLKITGTNMGNYSGTLFLIRGNAQVNNGTFEMTLGDSLGQGAGIGAIILVDIQSGTLTVNNPQSLVLNANSNHNLSTAIVGNNKITLNNVSQILNINKEDIVLPPFLELGLKRSTFTPTGMALDVPSLVLLNGQRKLTKEIITNLPEAYQKLLNPLMTLGLVKEGMTYDDIFKNIIIAAFGNRALLPTGYNNVRFKSANPDGFLDLERVNVAVNGDGSRTVTGHIVNYTEEKDGPGSDGIFSRILPGGTHAYISAKIGNTVITNKVADSNPYKDTKIDSNVLPNEFAAQADGNGNFSFTIPADQVNKLTPGTKIELTPHANFIGYDPNNKNDHTYDLLIKDISKVRTDAATAIKDAVSAAKTKVGNNPNLTEQAKTAFDAAMNKYGQDAVSPVPDGHNDTSVYAPSANDEVAINSRRDQAVQGVNAALTNAMKAIAKQEVASAAQDAKSKFPTIADKITDAIKDESAIDNVPGIDANNKVDDVQGKLNAAKDGLTAKIDQVIKDYKDGIRNDINQKINQAQKDIDQIAEDPNISQAAKAAITKLKDRTELSDAAAIAKDGGKIAQGADEKAVKDNQDLANSEIKKITDMIDAIKKVEQAAQDQITKHPEDKDDIQDSLNDIINNITNGKDDGKGADIINNIPVIKEGQKKAASDINQAATTAIEQISKLGLSDADKQNYIDAINAAKDLATAKPNDSKFDKDKSVYGQNTQLGIDQIVTAAKNTFNKEAAKADLANTAKSYLDSIGLTTDTEMANALKQGQDQIDTVLDGVPVADNATAVATAKKSAESKLLVAAKQAAKNQLIAYESQIETNIKNLHLPSDAETIAINKAKAVISDQGEDFTAINKASDKTGLHDASETGHAKLSDIFAQATKDALKSNAIQQIQNKQAEIKNNIADQSKYPNLDPDNVAKLQKDVDDAAQAGIAKITNERDNDRITPDLNEALNNIAGVAADAASLNDLIGQRKAAIAKLQQKAQAAKEQIEVKTDTELSTTDKANYKNLIDQHEKAGEISINGADKDNVDNAESLAEQQIDKDLAAAELDAAKSRASKAVNDQYQTDLNTINDSKLDDQAKKDYINHLNKIKDDGLAQINAGQNLEVVNQAKADTIKGMDQLVAGISDKVAQELEKYRNTVRDDLDKAAQAVRQHIEQDPNLSDNEKNKYYQDIDVVVADANRVINSASDSSAIDTAVRAGKGKLTQIQAQVDLQSAKEAAQHDLLVEQGKVINQINALKNINSDEKNSLINQVNGIYDNAKQEIDSQDTIQQVVKSRDQGIAKMDEVVKGARDRDLAATINADLGKLDAAAENAIAEINNSTLPNTAKTQAQKDIEDARDQAKERVKNSITSETANAEEATGETNINRIKNDALKQDLDAAKTAGKKAVDDAAEAAKNRINAQFDKLTDAEKLAAQNAKEKARGAIDDAKTKADQAIDRAISKTDINNLVTDATNNINQAENDFNLDIIKLQANNAISQHAEDAKAGLDPTNTNQKATIDAINNIVNDAENSINGTTDANTIRFIKEGAISAIDGIKQSAQDQALAEAKNKAIAELDKALKGDAQANPPVSGIKDKIAALPELSSKQMQQFTDQAQAAHDQAVNEINGSNSLTDINANKVAGLANIGQALTDATLQNAKAKASNDLNQYATGAKGSYANSTNLDDKQKQALDKRINDTVANAQAELKRPTTDTTAKVDAIVSAAKGAIDGIKADAQDTSNLNKNKESAINRLEDEANRLRQRVNDGGINHTLDTAQSNQLLAEINAALNAGKQAINAVKSEADPAKAAADLVTAEATGMGKLAAVDAHITYEETLTADLQRITAAATAAKQKAHDIAQNSTVEDKAKLEAEMVQQIEAEAAKASAAINKAKTDARNNNDQNPTVEMNKQTAAGEAAIAHLTESFEKKSVAINTLVGHANEAKDNLENYGKNADDSTHPYLSGKDLADGRQAVNDALQHGISDILGTPVSEEANVDQIVDAALTAAKTKVDQATYPTQLLAEKNKQLAAIKAAAEKAKDSITAKASAGLPPDVIDNLKHQIDDLLTKTTERINGVKLEDTDIANDINKAKTMVDNIEAGIDPNNNSDPNEKYTYGQHAISGIVTIADETLDLIRAKIAAINRLESYRDQKKNEVSQIPGLTSEDLENYQKQIEAVFEKDGRNRINAISSKDGKNSELLGLVNIRENTAKGEMDAIVNQANRQAANNKIISDLQNYKNTAQDIINNSQLSQDQKATAKGDIDNAFNTAKKLIDENTAKVNDETTPSDPIDQLQIDKWKANIDTVLANPEYVTAEKHYAVNGLDQEVTGLQSGLDSIGIDINHLNDQQKKDYQANIDTIKQSITNINNINPDQTDKDTLKNATAEYVKGLIALNKLKAKIKLDQAAAAAKEKAPKGGKDIDDATNKAKGNIDSLPNDVSPTDKVKDIIEDINGAEQTGEGNINSAENNSVAKDVEDARKTAAAKVKTHYDDAVTQLGTGAHDNTDNALNRHKDKDGNIIIPGTSIGAINDNKIAIEREIAKGAVEDAAANAKTKVESLKRPDGSDYTKIEKQAIIKQIEQERTAATKENGSIDQSKSAEDVTSAQNTAIGNIKNDLTDTEKIKDILDKDLDVQKERLEKARTDAANEVKTHYNDAVTQLGTDVHDNADNALKKYKDKDGKIVIPGDKIEDVQTNKLTAEKEIAKGAVEDAAANAKTKVESLKRPDGSDYTKIEKQAIIKQIEQERTAATKENGSIDQSKSAEDVTSAQNTAIGNIKNDLTDTEKIKDILDKDSAVQQERLEKARTDAANEVKTHYNDAVTQLGTDVHDNADNALKKYKDKDGKIVIPGDKIEDVQTNKLTAEKEIAKGAVEDALIDAKNKVAGLTHDDKTPFTDIEKQAIIKQIEQERTAATKENGSIDQSKSAEDVTSAQNTAIGNIKNDLTDTEKIKDILDKDSAVQQERLEKARTDAANEVKTHYNDAVTQLGTDVHDNADNALKKYKDKDGKIVIPGDKIEDVQTNKLTAEKEIAKGAVEDALIDAKNKVAGLTHDDKTPFTDIEKQAIIKQIEQERTAATKENGSIDQSKSAEDVTSAQNTAIGNIKNDLTDTEKIKDILDKDSAVQQERRQKAEAELNQKHQDAIDQIHNEFGDQANTSNTDKGFNDHKQITGNTEQEINDNKLAAEKEIAKGAVDDIANNAKTKVDGLKHQDGSDYTANEKEAIKDKIDQIVTEGKGKIDASTTTSEVDTNRDAAINQIIKDSTQDSDAAKDIWTNDPKVQNDQAKQKAEDELNQKHQDAVEQIHKEFGDQANTSNTDKGFNDHKQITGNTEQEINDNKLAAEKEIAKGVVDDVATNAKKKVDSLKHQDGSDYTANEKEAIKGKIDQIVTEGKGKIDKSTTTGEVDTNRDAAINQIIKDSTQDSDSAKDIWTNDPKIQNDQAKQKAEDELNQKHQDAIDQIHNEFGDQANTSKTDKGFNDHKQITGNTEKEINDNKLAAEKEIAKGAVDDIANNAKTKVDGLKHKDGSDYTANEKQAIKDQIDQIVTEGKDKIDKSTTTGEVDTNRDAAINQIIKDSTQDSDAAKDIWTNDPKVQNDQAKQKAEDELNQKHQDAVEQIHKEFGDQANTSNTDKGFNDHKQITGNTEQEINDNKLAAEKEIAKGVVDDIATNAKKKVDGLKHQDGSDYTANEKEAIKDKIDQIVTEGKGKIDASTTTSEVDTNRDAAINQIIKDSTQDSDSAKDIWTNDPKVQNDQAKQKAEDELNQKHQDAIDQIHKEFGDQANTSNTDKGFNDHKQITGNTEKEINDNKLVAEKEIAKGAVEDAAANAKTKVDGLKHQDGSDYTANEKQAIKDQIDQIVTEGKGKIDNSKTTGEVDTNRDAAINQIIKDSTQDSDAAKDIWTKDPKVQNDRNHHDSGNIPNVPGTPGTPGTPNDTANKPNSSDSEPDHNSSSKDNAHGVDVTLMHNAYLYDQTGSRCNKVILGAGSVVTTYGVTTINGRQFYILHDQNAANKQYYLALGNVKYRVQKLVHNAAVYDQYGRRINSAGLLRKDRLINTYGSAVTIRGSLYFIIAKHRYVKASNVMLKKIVTETQAEEVEPINTPTADAAVAVNEKQIMHNAYVYDEKGTRSNQLIFKAGSIVNTIGTKTINNRLFYVLENGMYIAAGNIDAKKLRLKHNAYLYSQYGNRLNHSVVRKYKLVRTYGSPVRIKNGTYYIIAKNKNIKEANFITK